MALFCKCITVVNSIDKSGVTSFLYKLGMVNNKLLGYANLYNYYSIQLLTGHSRPEAVKLAARKFNVTRRSVYNAIKAMEEKIEVPAALEKLLSII